MSLLRLAVVRLAHAGLLALGVVLVLFLILESGLTGDPAMRMAGRRPSPSTLGEARVRLGYFESFEASAVRLQLSGPRARVYLQSIGSVLQISDSQGSELARIDLAGRDLQQSQAAIEKLYLGSDLSLIYTLLADGKLPARGLTDALADSRLALDSLISSDLGWAKVRPGWQRFLHQCGSLLRFDFGRSMDGQRISHELKSRGLRSLALTVPALFFSTLLAIGMALWSTSLRGGFDRRLATLATLGMSVSALAWILFLRAGLVGRLGWFPAGGWNPPFLSYLVLPILIWILLAFSPDFLLYRTLFQRERKRPHVLTARAKGVGAPRLQFTHILRSAAVPVLAQIVLAVPFLVLGSVLLERVFVIPGLGNYLVDAAISGDASVLRAITFLIAILYILSQWFGDLLAAWADPRLARSRKA
jgi:peptide/nickel transport system permease protein